MKMLLDYAWATFKEHLGDKAMWVTILGWLVMGLNKWLKLGFDDNAANALVVALAGYLAIHLAHTAINKDKPNA
jgi:hypothetical protein